MDTNKEKDYEIEIDLRQLFFVVWEKAAIIILVCVICALGAFIYSKFVITPQYSSKATVYIQNKVDSDSTTTYSDTLSASNLANDFEKMITTRTVLDEVITSLDLKCSVYNLSSRVSVNSPSGSRILYISVKDSDPYQAKLIVDEIVKVAQKRSKDMMDIDSVKNWEDGSLSTAPTSPNVKKNVLIAFAAAFLFMIVLIILLNALDDTFKRSEDVEHKLGLSVLGSIPYEEEKKKKKGRRASKR